MASFQERLQAMKAKQETADEKKNREEAEKLAAEAARVEREGKRGELSAEQEAIAGESSRMEGIASEAREAIMQADAFAAEQGENLDDEAKAEIEAIKTEAADVEERLSQLKAGLEDWSNDIAQLETPVEKSEDTDSVEVESNLVPEKKSQQNEGFGKFKEELIGQINQCKKEVLEVIEKEGTSDLEDSELIGLYNSLDKPATIESVLKERAQKYEKIDFFLAAAPFYEVLGDEESLQKMNHKEIDKLKSEVAEDLGRNTLQIRVYELLGDFYEKVGDSEKAERTYEKIAKAIDKGGVVNGLNYYISGDAKDKAAIFEKLKDGQRAKKAWETAAKTCGRAYQERAGEYYEKAGNYEKAQESYTKAIAYQEELEKNNSEVDYKRLAKAYAGIGNPQKAVEILAKYAEGLRTAEGKYPIYQKIEEYLK